MTLLPTDAQQQSVDRFPIHRLDQILSIHPSPGEKKGAVAETALIAVVDDDHLMRRSPARLLRSAGFRAESFSSAEDYLDSGNHEGTSCIIPDIGLPGMSGFGLERHLAAIDHRLPGVFVSARDGPEVQQKASQEGAIAFLAKPFDGNALLDAVYTALGLAKRKRNHIFVLCIWIRQMQRTSPSAPKSLGRVAK